MPPTPEEIEVARVETERVAADASTQSTNQNTPQNNTGLNVDTTQQGNNQQQLFMQVLREREQANLDLQRQLNEARSGNTNNRQTEDQWSTFTGAPRDLIREEVAASMVGVNNFIANFQREQDIAKLKNLYRNNPQFAPIFQHAESHVDALLANASSVNSNTIQMALLTVGGAIATGQLQIPGFTLGLVGNNNPNPTTNPNPAPRNPTIPPETPRTTTPLPLNNPTNTNTPRQLTESERRLARSSNLTDEQYLAGLSDPPLTVPNIRPTTPAK